MLSICAYFLIRHDVTLRLFAIFFRSLILLNVFFFVF